MGGAVAVDADVAAQGSVTLCLPPAEGSDRASLPAYDLNDPACSLPAPSALSSGLADGLGLGNSCSNSDMGGAVRLTSLRSTAHGGLSTLSADDVLLLGCGSCELSPQCGGDSDCASDDSFAGGSALMPTIPLRCNGSTGELCSLLPQSLASIPAKTTGETVLHRMY